MTVTTRTDPSTVPCVITTGDGGALTVEGIPGAQAGVVLLLRSGISAQWQPAPHLEESPFAFVALGVHVHVVWFCLERPVGRYEVAACGRDFHALREPLRADQRAVSTVRACPGCLRMWNARVVHGRYRLPDGGTCSPDRQTLPHRPDTGVISNG